MRFTALTPILPVSLAPPIVILWRFKKKYQAFLDLCSCRSTIDRYYRCGYLLRYGDSSTWVITQAWPDCLSRYQLLLLVSSLHRTVNSRYEPAPRTLHQTIRVGSNVYMWAGVVDGMPEYTTVETKDGLYPVWRCSTVRLETGYISQQVELLHWECMDMAVLQWVIHSTSLVWLLYLTMVTVLSYTSTLMNHWAPLTQ